MLYRTLWIVCVLLVAASCTEQQRESLASDPVAFGDANGILVVMDEAHWNGAVGDSLRFYYEGPFILMPKPEPIFDLQYTKPIDFREFKRQLRTIIIAGNISDETSTAAKLIRSQLGEENVLRAKEDASYNVAQQKNTWAAGQQVIYLFSNSEEALANSFRKSFNAVSKRIQKEDLKQIVANTYAGGGTSYEIEEALRRDFNIKLDVPKFYRISLNKNQTMWLRYDTDEVGYNIMIKDLGQYNSDEQLNKELFVKTFKETGKYVKTKIENTYMTLEDKHLPIFYDEVALNNFYAYEARGVWRVVNDFMGGPYVAYLVYNPNNNRVVYVCGFIWAPSVDRQRDYIQRLEVILNTLEF